MLQAECAAMTHCESRPFTPRRRREQNVNQTS